MPQVFPANEISSAISLKKDDNIYVCIYIYDVKMNLHKKEISFLILLLLLGSALRFIWFYTLIERDEGTFGYISWRITEGAHYFYSAGSKPPLIYLTYSLFISLFGNSISPIRIFNNLLFLASIPMFYLLSKKFLDERGAKYSALLYTVSMNIPIFEGSMALTESFVVFWSVAAMLVLFREKSFKNILIASALSAVAILYKQTAIILAILILLYAFGRKNTYLISLAAISISAILVIASTFFTDFFYQIAFKTFKSLLEPSYIPWNYALLILLESLFLLILFIYGLPKWIKNQNEKIIISWAILALGVSLLPNAYGHYFLQLVPPFSMIGGMGLSESLKRKNGLLFVSAIFIFSLFFQFSQYPDFNVAFIDRLTWSDSKTRSDQETMSELIRNSSGKDDAILMFGNEPAIAWLSSRKLYMEEVALDCTQSDIVVSLIGSEINNLSTIVLDPDYSNCYTYYNLSLAGFKAHRIGSTEIYIRD